MYFYVVVFSERLLRQMMEIVAIKCPIDEFERLSVKMRLDKEDTIKITSDKSLLEHEQLSKLLKIWRKTYGVNYKYFLLIS